MMGSGTNKERKAKDAHLWWTPADRKDRVPLESLARRLLGKEAAWLASCGSLAPMGETTA